MRNWVISIVSGEARAIFLYFLFNHKEKLKVDLICENVPGTQGYAYTKVRARRQLTIGENNQEMARNRK